MKVSVIILFVFNLLKVFGNQDIGDNELTTYNLEYLTTPLIYKDSFCCGISRLIHPRCIFGGFKCPITTTPKPKVNKTISYYSDYFCCATIARIINPRCIFFFDFKWPPRITTTTPTTPTTIKTTPKLAIQRLTTQKPTYSKPTTQKQSNKKPSTQKPSTQKPSTQKQTTQKPVTLKVTSKRP